MTSAAPTSAFLSGAPAAEEQDRPLDPFVPGGSFDSLMAQAALKPDAETPQGEPADTDSDKGPGAQTQRAPAKSLPRQDQDSGTNQILCWLPNWLAASVCQPLIGAGATVLSPRISPPAPEAGKGAVQDNSEPDARVSPPVPEVGKGLPGEEDASLPGGPRAGGSSAALSGPPEPLGSSSVKAAPQGTVREPSDPAVSKDPGSNESQRASAEVSGTPAPSKPTDGAGPPAPGTTINSPASEHGMSAAPHADAMSAPTEVNDISCPGEQKLPGTAADVVVPAAGERERRAGGEASEPDSIMPSGAAQPGLATPEPSAGQEMAARSESLCSQRGAVEAVRHAIDNAAAGLQRGDGASVSLVLRPGSNIQLSLHVKLQQGHLEALAVLEHGDFAALGAEWTGLQNRLAEQGVRLAPLAPGPEHSMSFLGGESHGARQEREPENSTPAIEDLDKLAATRTVTSMSAARNKSSSSQREWWA